MNEARFYAPNDVEQSFLQLVTQITEIAPGATSDFSALDAILRQVSLSQARRKQLDGWLSAPPVPQTKAMRIHN